MMIKRSIKKWKKIAATLMAVTMLSGVATPFSQSVQAAQKGSVTINNTISKGISLATDSELTGEEEKTTEVDATYNTISAVAAYVAKRMTDREKSFSVIYTGEDYDTYGDRGKIKNDLLPKVFDVDSAGTSDADYLYHIYKSIDVDYVVNFTNDYIRLVFDVEYWESKEETEYVDDNLTKIIDDCGLSEGATDFDKIKAVHDWICGNVSKGTSITSEVDNTTQIATLSPYTAFKYGQSSAAGYAGLAYKLLYKMGIQCAILQGPDMGSNTKIWNLVQLEGMWYHMSIYDDDKDTRNDGLPSTTYDYTYFLLGTDSQRKKLPVGNEYSGYTAYYEAAENDYFANNDPIYTVDGKKSLYGITAQFVGQEQEIGSFISKGQILVYAYYSKEDYDNKENSASVRVFDIQPIRVEKAGDNTVTVNYMGKTCNINIVGSNTPATDGKLKIDFMSNGGEAVDSITDISKNQNISIATIRPARDGYQFGGWYLDSTLQTKCPTKFSITQSITLYAKWEKIGVSAIKAEYNGEPLTVDAVYEKDSSGNNILGADGKPNIMRWEATINFSKLLVEAYKSDGSEETISDYNVSLKEGENDFECAYDNGKLLFNKTNQTFPSYGESIILLVEKDGKTDTFEVYLAEYWGQDETVTSGIVNIEVYEDVSDTGVPGSPYVVEVSRYSRFSEAGIKEPSRATETFAGWYLETDYINRITDYTRITEDTQIYAKWEKKTLKALKVEYTGSDLPVWSNIDLDKVLVKAFYDDYSVKTILDTYEISSTLVEKEGTNVFTVKYEEVNPYDTDEMISFTKTFTVEGYVTDEETYRVSFDSMGGTPVESISGVAKGETIQLPSEPTREGYSFKGWYRDSSCRVAFTENSKVTKDITLYAKWEEFRLVPYSIEAAYIGGKLNLGDAIPPNSIRVIGMYNDNVARVIDDFTYTPSTIFQEGINVITVSYENLNASVTIETGKAASTYIISFDSCGGTAVSDITGVLWGSQVKLPKPVKVGDEFLGWYTSKSYETQFTEDDFVTRDLTLYALWASGAELSGTPSPTVKATVTAKPTATKKPTATPKPTATTKPTATPKPTATLIPTVTPVTTGTALPSGTAATVTPAGTGSNKAVKSITAKYNGNDLAVGAAITKEDIEVTAAYEDGTEEKVTDFTFTPETISAEGVNVIVVKYEDKSATVTITGIAGTAGATATPAPGAQAAATPTTSGKNPSDNAKATATPGAATSDSADNKVVTTSKNMEDPKEFQKGINDIFSKVKNGNSDGQIKELAAALDAIREMTPREIAQLDKDVLRSLDTMIKNLSNVSVIIDNKAENYTVTENDVWGLATVLTSRDILSGEKVEVILEVSDALMLSGTRTLIEQYAGIQEKTIFKFLDIKVYKYIGYDGTNREDDKQSVSETVLPVHITLPIPMENQGQPYYCVIREHNEKVVAIPDEDGTEETISFESNYFSVYALAHGTTQVEKNEEEVSEEEGTMVSADAPVNSTNGDNGEEVETKQKTAPTWPFILAAIAVIALAIMVITIVVVKELNKEDEEDSVEKLSKMK